MHVKDWGLGVFYQCKEYAHMLHKIEGVTATRYFSPLLGKIELASFPCIKNISAPY